MRRQIAEKKQGPAGGFAVGRAGMEMLVRERLGVSRSLAEIEATGWMLIERIEEEIRLEARKFGRKSAKAILEEAAEKWEPKGPSLLEEYERVTGMMREAFDKKGLLTLPPGEKLRVLPVPDFLKHQFPTAAYRQPGPYSRDQTGIFWVNDLGAGMRDPAKKRAETRQHFGMELTCAHEAYPGHHVQFVIQNRHPSKLRRLFAHAIFYEGWTLWCEKMCVEQGILRKPEAKLQQLHDALWRACRIVIDCGLHSGTLTYKGAVRLLMERAGFTRARAEGDVNWYTSAPTVPMSYLLGRLELERLHARLTGAEGGPTGGSTIYPFLRRDSVELDLGSAIEDRGYESGGSMKNSKFEIRNSKRGNCGLRGWAWQPCGFVRIMGASGAKSFEFRISNFGFNPS